MLIHPYQKKWEEDFQQIQKILQEALVGLDVTIYHVGSTAIKNLAAKPIIDIDIAFQETVAFEDIQQRLEKLGYYHNGDQGIKDREAFKRQLTENHEVLDSIVHHLYVGPNYSEELKRHLTFRDYLRTHEKERQAYEQLKFQIAEEAEQNKKRYAQLKEKQARTFVESVLEKAKMK